MAYDCEQRDYIRQLHELSGRNSSTAVELFQKKYHACITEPTVRKIWRDFRLEIPPPGKRKAIFDEHAFRGLYEQCKGKILIMGVKSGKKRSWLERKCKQLNLPYDI